MCDHKMNIISFVSLLLYNISLLSCEVLDHNPYLEAIKPWKSIQEYAEIRPGAFLFYWLYYADGTPVEAERKPLIIWIQGGPGLAASGVANFAEIGPLTMDMKPRNHTWVHGKNLLLIDHPVGTGFSYAKNRSLYVRSDRQAVKDLARMIKIFFKRHKQFRSTPTYVIGQSYGSKLCPRLALILYKVINRKRIKMNFKGIGIGSAWVDPKRSSLVMPDFLYHMGIIDKKAYLQISTYTHEICEMIDKKMYSQIDILKQIILLTIYEENEMDMNYNNIYQDSPEPKLRNLEETVNKYVKPTLPVNQSLQWHYTSDEVFKDLTYNFYVGSTKYIEALLNHTKLKIAVYNGNLDVVTPLAGAANWVHALKWEKAEKFKQTARTQIRGIRNGYYKSLGPLSFWSVFQAGHWVPEDNPEAMEQILEHLLDLSD